MLDGGEGWVLDTLSANDTYDSFIPDRLYSDRPKATLIRMMKRVERKLKARASGKAP